MITSIVVNTYKKFLGGSSGAHSNLTPYLQRITKEQLVNLDKGMVDIFDLGGEAHSHNAGLKDERLCIFINACDTSQKDSYQEPPTKINGKNHPYTHFFTPSEDSLLIKSEEGTVLAEWKENVWTLNILFDLFKKQDNYANSLDIYKHIMKQLEELFFLPLVYKTSWLNTPDKSIFISKIEKSIVDQRERIVAEEKDRITVIERDINSHKTHINNLLKSLYQKRRLVMMDETYIKEVADNIVKDLDLIVNNEKVKDIHFKDGVFTIFTEELFIHHGKDKYYGGFYRITVNLMNSDVHFHGGTPRRSYWTMNDPHPHVNGRSGTACLGNISSTVAELCSQTQLYALTIILIDFLESVNTDDAAGRNIVNWDKVNEDGTIDKDETLGCCASCGSEVLEVELLDAYEGFNEDDGETYGHMRICRECANNEALYYYHDGIEAYIEVEDNDE